MKNDIVCGKPVNETSQFHTTYGDRPYYFCSDSCEMDFVSNPIRYVDKSGSVASTEGSPVIDAQGKKVHSQV